MIRAAKSCHAVATLGGENGTIARSCLYETRSLLRPGWPDFKAFPSKGNATRL